MTFDFVNCARAPLDSEPISEAHFQSILSCCNLDLHAVNDKIQLFSGLSQQLGEARHTNSKLSHINRRSNSVSQGGNAKRVSINHGVSPGPPNMPVEGREGDEAIETPVEILWTDQKGTRWADVVKHKVLVWVSVGSH